MFGQRDKPLAGSDAPERASGNDAGRWAVSRVSAGPAILALALVAWWESGTARTADDFGYLMWGLLAHAHPFAWVNGPDWLSYHRPLNALGWWISARTGVAGDAIRYLNAAFWLIGAVALVVVARRRRLVPVAVALLLTNQVWIDVLTWRSWLTTSGSTCFLLVGLLAMKKRARPAFVAAIALVAMGFKEMSPLALAIICVLTPGYRSVGAVVISAVGLGSVSSTYKLGLDFVPANTHFHVATLALFVPAIPLTLARRWPDLPWWAYLPVAAVAIAPSPIAAGAVLLAALVALRDRPAWLAAAALAWWLPQFGAAHARQYMLEGWLILALALVIDTPKLCWSAVLASAIIGLPAAFDFERHRDELRAQYVEQRTFLQSFHPPLASTLYRPDPMWAYDLDALWWVERGATLEDAPPPGSKPKQLGPRSGVWADLQGDQGSGTR